MCFVVVVYPAVELVIIGLKIAASIVPAVAIYGVAIAAASAWVYFKNGVKRTTNEHNTSELFTPISK